MKVILTQDVERLGQAGEVKDVATGYARNYLIPKGLALAATPGAIKQWSAQQKVQAAQEARLADQAEELVERMATLTLNFEAKAGPTGRLYGSVTTVDIAEALERELGLPFDRRKILSDPLREVGEHTVSVRFGPEAVAEIRAVVRAEGAEDVVEPEEAVEASEAEGIEEAAEDSIPQPDELETTTEE